MFNTRLFVNEQKPSPRIREGIGLNVHTIFYTIQGEGPFVGRPCVFVRLYGCNLQCPQCDTDYTSLQRNWSPTRLAQHVISLYPAPRPRLVIITGGEPFRQNIVPFIEALQNDGCTVQIETNGTLAPQENLPEATVIVCSPKTGRVNKRLLPSISAYKYVVTADQVLREDGLPLTALGHPAKPMLARPPAGFPVERIYVQPVDPDLDGANIAACKASCYKFGYTIGVQLHKIIGVD